MQVNVLLFGSLRDRLGFAQQAMEFPDLASLKNWLHETHPDLAALNYLIAVNQEIVQGNAALQAGDEVAIMPPFAGG